MEFLKFIIIIIIIIISNSNVSGCSSSRSCGCLFIFVKRRKCLYLAKTGNYIFGVGFLFAQIKAPVCCCFRLWSNPPVTLRDCC